MIKSRVFILYTGGTIGMAPSDPKDPASPLAPQPVESLLSFVPGLQGSANRDPAKSPWGPYLELPDGSLIELDFASLTKPVDSSDISPAEWKEIAKTIAAHYDDYDGFVILHGTDTMAFTASALSFMFENLGKPVVITGSQLPISAIRTDAVLNFVNAIYLAAYKATRLPLIPEVVIVFADRILRGCRASKVSTSDWAGFDSPNFPHLGNIGQRIVVNTSCVMPPPEAGMKFAVKSNLVDEVFTMSIFPGFSDKLMQKLFLDPALKGMIMRSYGTGNAPGNPLFLKTIARAVKGDAVEGSAICDGRLIVNLSQCSFGSVEMGLYQASSGLLEAGVISGLDMTPEAALTKLMWVLGTQSGPDRIRQMQISQRGEQTESVFDVFFHGKNTDSVPGKLIYSASPDGRLDRNRISRAMLRIKNLQIANAETDDEVRIRVFMNMPLASEAADPLKEQRCLIDFSFRNTTVKPGQTHVKNVTYKIQGAIDNGEVVLTLISEVKKGETWVPAEASSSGLYISVHTST